MMKGRAGPTPALRCLSASNFRAVDMLSPPAPPPLMLGLLNSSLPLPWPPGVFGANCTLRLQREGTLGCHLAGLITLTDVVRGSEEGERRGKGGCCPSVRGCVQARGPASGSKRYSRCLRGGGHAGGLVISLPESPMPAPQRYPLPVSPLGKDGERRLVDSVCELE